MSESELVGENRDVVVVYLDSGPINALNAEMRQHISDCIDHGQSDRDVKAIVLIGRGRYFSVGADIRELGTSSQSTRPTSNQLIREIEDCSKPVIAAINGAAVGGGLELALGCHYRIGDSNARVGLPEIKLGLPPGGGGTQRLPRLIGVEAALHMILSGELLDADKSRVLGLLDQVTSGDLLEGATAFAERLAAEGGPPRKVRELPISPAPVADVFDSARKSIERRAKGQIAPYRCIESVENATKFPFDDGLVKEAEYFIECEKSDQFGAQRHIFFAERQAAKIPDLPADTPARPIRSAAVIGCGTMGGGIAMNFANAGIPVSVLETSEAALETGLETVRTNYARSVSRGRISRDQMDRRMASIRGTQAYDDVAQADIVVEAVFEDMNLKREVFRTLDDVCEPGTILATNTSSLDIDEIAAATTRPDKVIGTHFFSPAHVMKLMENVRGKKTSAATIATVMSLSKALDKVGVLVRVCDGFVGNRMLDAYARQAYFLVDEGALPHQVDKAIYDFGFPMGLFAMADLSGLDIGWRIRQRQAKTRPKNQRYSPTADRICEMGRFGQKTGAGWYRYEPGSRTPIPDPVIAQLLIEISGELGIERREIDEREIMERCIYPTINEAAKILEEEIAIRPGDIDVVWVYGYGFPIYRGGPMFYADIVGLTKIYDTMSRMYDVHGDLLRPAPLLKELAECGKRFADL